LKKALVPWLLAHGPISAPSAIFTFDHREGWLTQIDYPYMLKPTKKDCLPAITVLHNQFQNV
jgi:hypothetical protein